VTGRRGRRHKQLLDECKEKREYWKLKYEAVDRTVWRTGFGMWRTGFGKSYGLVVKTDYEVNESSLIQALTFSVGSNDFFLITQKIEGKAAFSSPVMPCGVILFFCP
jgi:hypothetical protein